MTREERKKAIEVLDDMKVKIDIPKAAKTQNDRNWALDVAIQALSQEPCDDVVSRILTRMWNCRGKHTTSIDKVKMEQIIRDELSVTQKSGWIPVSERLPRRRYRCISNFRMWVNRHNAKRN